MALNKWSVTLTTFIASKKTAMFKNFNKDDTVDSFFFFFFLICSAFVLSFFAKVFLL